MTKHTDGNARLVIEQPARMELQVKQHAQWLTIATGTAEQLLRHVCNDDDQLKRSLFVSSTPLAKELRLRR